MLKDSRSRTADMKKLNRLAIFLTLLAACAGATRAAFADEPDKDKAYEVKLARPVKVGMKYHITTDGALVRETTISRAGVTAKQPDDGFGVHLEGTVEVLALDQIGEEAKVSIAIDKCTRITSAGENELVPKGKVLIAEGKGKDTRFSIEGGGELAKEASDALELVVSLDTNDTLTDDDLLGTKEKKKVGESWPVSPENVAKDSERVGVEVKPQDVEGSFQIDGLEKKGDEPCLKLSGNLKVKKLVTKADEKEGGGLPEGYVVEGGSMEAKYTGLFPVDSSKGSLAESASMTFVTHVKGKGGGGDAVTIESRVHRAVDMKRRFLEGKE
jgi:hypothetical protein